jgi:hypothetical protein
MVNSRPIFRDALKPGYHYHVFWSTRQESAERISSLTGQNDRILAYPHDMDLYALSRRLPPDRFVYWFPWVDSVPAYRSERLTALTSTPPPLIYLGSMNFKDQPNYYLQFFPNLTAGYTEYLKDGKSTGIWLLSRL